MLAQFIKEIVEALYDRSPNAYLMHADLDLEETQHDNQNSTLLAICSFDVSVTPAMKVRLQFDTIFDKRNNKSWTRGLGVFYVYHKESHTSIGMANSRGKIAIWDHEKAEAFQTLIGNPAA